MGIVIAIVGVAVGAFLIGLGAMRMRMQLNHAFLPVVLGVLSVLVMGALLLDWTGITT